MQEIIDKILFHLERSQVAYELYFKDKKYYQALRIYKANQEVYELITEYAHLWKEDKATIIKYLFHLEDWFEQFAYLADSENTPLDREFVFTRLEHSPPFPSDIFQIIRNTKIV